MSATIAPVAPREEFVTVTGCRTLVLRGGEGPPLLFIHGGGGLPGWQDWMSRLAERHEVICPEMPGYGRSDTPAWFENIHDVAYFVLDLLERLGLRGIHLLGHSLGGWIASEVAIRDVSRLGSIALVAPSGLHVRGVPKPDIFLMTPAEMAEARFHDPRLAQAALAAEASDEDLDRELKNRFATARLMWAPRGFDPHLEKWLHRISVPSLVLWGAQDRILPAGPYSERWASLLPRATVRIIEACGHVPQVEQAGAFCDILESFMAGSDKA